MDQFDKQFAEHWDEPVGWEDRARAEIPFIMSLIEKFNCKSVLDVATGTGFHSIELLKKELYVKSADGSADMIDVAHKNAKKHGVQLNTVCADWTQLDRKISEKFDCILCLGNSLACEMDPGKQEQAVYGWSQCLSENGIVIVDRRNYEALLSGDYNYKSKGQYLGKTVKIAPIKVAANETEFAYTFADGAIHTLNMYPIRQGQLNEHFKKAGLVLTERYGDQEPSRIDSNVSFYTCIYRKTENAKL